MRLTETHRALGTLALAVVLLAVLAPVVGGCANRLPEGATTLPTDARTDVVTEWEREPSLPTADTRVCRADLDATKVAVVGDEAFTEQCIACPPGKCPGREPTEACPWGCAASCAVADCWGGWLRSAAEIGCDRREPLLVVHESAAQSRAIRHELTHVVSTCAMGHSDRWHKSDAVWSEGGVLDRAGGQPVR